MKPFANPDFVLRTHPFIDKPTFADEHVLAMGDGRPFPSTELLGVMKWRAKALGVTPIPLKFSCAVTETEATFEYQLVDNALSLDDVALTLPPSDEVPAGADVSQGEVTLDTEGGSNAVLWYIGSVSQAAPTGRLVVPTAAAADLSKALFPASVSFTAASTAAGIQVGSVANAETGAPVEFELRAHSCANNYTIEAE